MRVVAVEGVGSGSGKTAFLTRLLAELPDWCALKTSPVKDGGHRHGLAGDYELVLDMTRLSVPGTDTEAYLATGARRVGWLIARPPLSAAARGAVLEAFRGAPGLLVEGGSLADGLGPERRYLVVRPGSVAVKPEARERLASRESITVDASRGDDPTIAELIREFTAWARR